MLSDRSHLHTALSPYQSIRSLVTCTIYFLIFWSMSQASAQIATVNNTTSTPIPGVGHDYIHDAAEIVNPANGSVSIRIAAPTPKMRGVSMPLYAYIYDTSGQFNVSFTSSVEDRGETESPRFTQKVMGPNAVGTSSGIPLFFNRPGELSYADTSFTYRTDPTAGSGSPTVQCNMFSNFIYTDLSGGRHDLQASDEWQPSFSNCSSLEINTYARSGDEQFKIDTTNYTGTNADSLHSVIVDIHGDLEVMPVGGGGVPGQAGPPIGTSGTFEDTNGNYPNTTGQTWTYGTNYPGTPYPSSMIAPGYASPYNYTYETAPQAGPVLNALLVYDTTGESSFCDSSYSAVLTPNPYVLQKLSLPNGQSYDFTYDSVSSYISQLTYPTGAWVKYTWANNPQSEIVGYEGNASIGQPIDFDPSPICVYKHDWIALQKRIVSYDGVNSAQEQDFTYTTTWPNVTIWGLGTTWTNKTTTVTTVDLIRPGHPSYKTIYNYIPYTTPSVGTSTVYPGSTIPVEDTIVYQDTSGNTLKTVKKVWNSVNQLAAECETVGTSTAGRFYQYASYTGFGTGTTSVYGLGELTNLVTDETAFDYGAVTTSCQKPSTSPLRETKTTYASLGSLPEWNGSPMVDRPASVQTYGGGTLIAETDYTYDEPSPALSSVSPIPYGHDEANYGSGNKTVYPRGNLTTVMQKCFLSSGSACTNSVSHFAYDTTGQIVKVTDANNDVTLLSHADNFTTDDGTPPGNTNTFLTQITRPTAGSVAHISSFQYDFGKGELRAATDENGKTSNYSYNDPWDRLTQSSFPDGGLTTATYNDIGPNPSVTTTELLNSSSPVKSTTTTLDAYGHTIQTALISDPSGTDYVSTVYDGAGLPYTVSTPYRANTDSAYGLTTFTYDALGRSTSVLYPDSNSTSITYASNITTSKDEVGNSWTRTEDSLGRLVGVLEPGSLQTAYSYDALNNLKAVTQSGTTSDKPRNRSFNYNSLGRLLTSSNPETGTICYGVWSGGSVGSGTCQNGYDANGNLLAKTLASGVVTSYAYDSLNRLTSKSASDSSVKDTFYYDVIPASYSVSSLSCSNGIGRLCLADHQGFAGTAFAYDALGRTVQTSVAVPPYLGNYSLGMKAQYDLAGDMVSITYPDTRQVTQTFDSAGRLATVSSGGVNIISGGSGSGIAYWPSGQEQASTLGNGVAETSQINNRLQPCRFTASSPVLTAVSSGGNLLDRGSFYQGSATFNCGSETGNNGNIFSVIDNLNSGWSQAFSYDNLNRLSTAYRLDSSSNAGSYSHTYNYDSFGNMTVQDNLHSNPTWAIDAATNELLRDPVSGTDSYGHPLNDFTYDLNGNMVSSGAAGHTYTYNALNQVNAVDGGSTAGYTYDGLDERANKAVGSAWTGYVYLNGQPMAEYTSAGTWTDYIYANGEKIAKVDSQKPLFHMHGVRDGTTPNIGCGLIPAIPGISNAILNQTIKNGDKMVYDIRQTSTGSPLASAFAIALQNGQVVGGSTDAEGNIPANRSVSGTNWQHSVSDISSFAGQVMTDVMAGIQGSPSTGYGTWDIWIANAAVVRANGSILPIFTGQSASVSGITSTCGGNGQTFQTEVTPVSDPNIDTNYYVDDHLGTAQMEINGGGWPVWEGQFTPFGAELADGNTAMHYKFTGKERDAESGLDYFGARYYASSMGRWMSPDWASNPEAVPYSHLDNPQSLNLYGYVLNNPLAKPDLDGHGCPPDCGDPTMATQVAPPSFLQNAKDFFSLPFTNDYTAGGAKILIGGGLVATAAFGDVPGGVAGTLLVANTVLGGTASAVSGTTQIMGAATNTNTSEAREALSATSTGPGLVTAAATGGNLKAAGVVSTVTNAATLAAAPKDAVKNLATGADAAQTVKETTGLVQTMVNAVKSFFVPPPPPPKQHQ